MSTRDAFGFVTELEVEGLRFHELEPNSDIAVIIVGSESALPAWISVGPINGRLACWASDYPTGELVRPEPGFLLRCPRSAYDSLAELFSQCGAEVHEATPAEPTDFVLLRCVREDAEIMIEVIGKDDGDGPVGLWGRRQLSRRTQFRADVTLIRDLVAVLRQAGAEVG